LRRGQRGARARDAFIRRLESEQREAWEGEHPPEGSYVPRPHSPLTRTLERGTEPPGAYFPTRACALAMHPRAIPDGWRIVWLGGRVFIERPARPSDGEVRVVSAHRRLVLADLGLTPDTGTAGS
jgi:hypothetical protein